MTLRNIPYQGFCWVIGTTSFRTAKLNLKIEEQLWLLDAFQKKRGGDAHWTWDSAVQERYYEFMQEQGFLHGDAPRKDKDAREKTSGLVDIGLVTEDRRLTDAGRELLTITEEGVFEDDNVFQISRDSFVYFKQLLKATIAVGEASVRPFLVLLQCLTEFGSLRYEEFTYLVPLMKDKESRRRILSRISDYRKKKVRLEDIIYERLMGMANYQAAWEELRRREVDEVLICLVGLNRKSRTYDRPYYALYENLKRVFVQQGTDCEALWDAAKSIRQKPGSLWRNLLFRTAKVGVIRQKGRQALVPDCPFFGCTTEEALKAVFFKYLHVFKAMATLADYFDLNRRYFNLTDMILFEDQQITLDVLPKYYFREMGRELFQDAFVPCEHLTKAVPLSTISNAFQMDMGCVYAALSCDLRVSIKTAQQAATFVNDARYRRFNQLIDTRFSDSILLELLDCFERRDDKRIEELVTDAATIPTIFEYILGIIWYKVSERRGNILDFMKLSLEANLLPKTHAAGGYADIIYEYEVSPHYPKHALLIEATLTDGTNQRRMEMEPVSRHLGEYRIRFQNPFDYSLFVSTYLDKNVVTDFRYRKNVPYTRDEETIPGMKIISIDTATLKKILTGGIKYAYLYQVFDKYHEMPLGDPAWHGDMVKEAAGTYQV